MISMLDDNEDEAVIAGYLMMGDGLNGSELVVIVWGEPEGEDVFSALGLFPYLLSLTACLDPDLEGLALIGIGDWY